MPKHSSPQNQVSPLSIILGAVFILLFVCVFNSITIIQPGTVGVVVRLGKAQENVLDEGMHFVIPFVTQVHTVDVKVLKEVIKTDAASKDQQTVKASFVINYRVDKEKVVTLFRKVSRNYLEVLIQPKILEAFKTGSTKYNAEELITERAKVSAEVLAAIQANEQLLEVGVIVVDVSITDFDFSPEFNKAIEAKVTADQRAKQAERELERFKFEADQKIATARGDAESVMLKAKAEAEALNLKKQYATMELIWLSAVEKWDGKLPTHLFASPPMPVFDTGK